MHARAGRPRRSPDPADPTLDNIVTTQRHEERRVRRAGRWKLAAVKELGGTILVNGAPYTPPE